MTMKKGKLFSRHLVCDKLLLATNGKGEKASTCEKMSDYPQKAFVTCISCPVSGAIPKASLAYCDINAISRSFEWQDEPRAPHDHGAAKMGQLTPYHRDAGSHRARGSH